jgi:hypothetical protein
LHDNFLTGTTPFQVPFPSSGYLNLASNFLVGNVPTVSNGMKYDFRFNFFDNCDDLCCLTNTDCPKCDGFMENVTTIPFGVEKSVWTELIGVSVLGVKKRIIQIETHFQSPPFLLNSYACPSTFALEFCNTTREISVRSYSDDVIVLPPNASYVNSQTLQTTLQYVYTIQGDPCRATVLVRSNLLSSIMPYTYFLQDFCGALCG